MNEKLKPCPFCGTADSADRIAGLFVRTTDMFWPARIPNDPVKEEDFVVWVHCGTCECDGPKVDIVDHVGWTDAQLKSKAAELWNTRKP